MSIQVLGFREETVAESLSPDLWKVVPEPYAGTLSMAYRYPTVIGTWSADVLRPNSGGTADHDSP